MEEKYPKNMEWLFWFMSQWNIAPMLGNFYRVPHPLSLIVIMYPSFLRSSSCNCEEENIERKHFKLRHSITWIFELAILMALLITDPLRLVFTSLSYLLTPDSPNGFWKLSEEISNRISDDSEHVSYLLANRDVAMRQNIMFKN